MDVARYADSNGYEHDVDPRRLFTLIRTSSAARHRLVISHIVPQAVMFRGIMPRTGDCWAPRIVFPDALSPTLPMVSDVRGTDRCHRALQERPG
jgi:hypothetical protein